MPASEERSISEFPSALSILATTLLLVSTYDSGNDAYDSEKVTAVDLASAILGDFEFTQDLFTNVKTIFGAINSIMCLYGHNIPSGSQGTDGQFYVKYTSSGGVDTVDGLYWKINDAWVEVSTGGGGGGASVTLGTTVPSDATGSNGDLYVQYDGTTYAVIEYFVKINGSWRKSPYSRVVALTQAEYDLIIPDPTTLYIITDAQSSYQTKTDNSLATSDKTVVGAINELNTNKQDALSFHSANSSSAISVNGTYQIPANVLAHTFIVIACRRGGYGNSIMFKKEELLTFDNGFTFLGKGDGYYTLKCSNTGLLTVVNIVNMSEPYILVTGLL